MTVDGTSCGSGDDGRVRVELEVNGEPHLLAVRSDDRLLDVLRSLDLFSVRDGCSVGMCGACTVLVDGRAVSSCLTLAALCDSARVRTAEGLADGDRLDPVAAALLEGRAFQCSYCTPGFVLALKALLDEDPAPGPEQVRTWLAGHICRCGSYSRILDTAAALVAGIADGGRPEAGGDGR